MGDVQICVLDTYGTGLPCGAAWALNLATMTSDLINITDQIEVSRERVVELQCVMEGGSIFRQYPEVKPSAYALYIGNTTKRMPTFPFNAVQCSSNRQFNVILPPPPPPPPMYSVRVGI